MRILSIIFTLFSFISLFSQIKYEKGYIINNKGEKKNVLIKNWDWDLSPTEISYKIQENEPALVGNPNNLSEFGFADGSKFVRYNGKVDVSSSNIDGYTNNNQPIWENKSVFLKELVPGNKSLWSYREKGEVRFYYQDYTNEITPLIFKKYNIEGKVNLIGTNEDYKEQLNKLFEDKESSKKLVEITGYNTTDLIKIFSDYNNVPIKKNKIKFELTPRIGFSFLKLDVISSRSERNSYFEETSPRLGVELEVILPINKNKWSAIMELNYSKISGSYDNTNISEYNKYYTKVDYRFIDVPIGMRYYLFVNDKSKFFLNTQINAFSFNIGDEKISLNLDGIEVSYNEIGKTSAFDQVFFGVGYKYGRFSIEGRVSTNKSLINGSSTNSVFKNSSVILGYSLF